MLQNSEGCTNVKKKESEVPSGTERTRSGKVYVPQVDIVETDNAVTLYVNMPGVDEQHLDITIEKNTLTLQGQITPPAWEGYSLVAEEYGVGDYERVFTISNDVDRDRVEAVLKNGVLTLVLPKVQHAVAKKVAVCAG